MRSRCAAAPYPAARRWLMTEPLRVLIADDHPAFLAGLRVLLDSLVGVEVVGEASTGEQAVASAVELVPDVIVMDLQMPGIGGIEATARVVDAAPHVQGLVLTMFDHEDSLFAALRAGARGYLLKGGGQDELAHAIRAIAQGGAIFCPAIAARLIEFFARQRDTQPALALPDLTDRERELLELIASGLPNSEIARRLILSPETVGNHVSAILEKVQVRHRGEALARGHERRLGQPG